MNVQSVIDDVCPKIGDLGHLFYFDPGTLAAGREHDLDGFRFYFLGRGGVLGDVESEVVGSAFGYFHPALVERTWTSAKQRYSPRAAGRLYVECCGRFGRARLSGLSGLGAFCDAAEAVCAAAEPAGLALYAGLAAEPRADDVAARAMQLLTLLREYRGGVHLLAVVASGLSPRLAHALRRPDACAMFGWDEQPPPVTEHDRVRLEQADRLTDDLLAPAFSVLDDTAAASLVAGVDAAMSVLRPDDGVRRPSAAG